jgi:multiple sugar transport system substrate-binding protein
VPGKTGALTSTLGVHDDIVVFKNGDSSAKLAAIKEFLDFTYQDQYQLQFDNEYDLLPATQSAAKTMASQNAMFAAFLNNISSSVNYPTNTNWGTVDSAIEQQVGAAINGSPSQVLNTLQQTASSGS